MQTSEASNYFLYLVFYLNLALFVLSTHFCIDHSKHLEGILYGKFVYCNFWAMQTSPSNKWKQIPEGVRFQHIPQRSECRCAFLLNLNKLNFS